MKVEITKEHEETGKDKFPHLGIYSDGVIVLFYDYGMGTVLYDTAERCSIGYYDTNWLHDYKLFTGEIKLSND